MAKSYLPIVALFFVAVFYGGNYSVSKIIFDSDHMDPLFLAFLRVMTGAVGFTIANVLFIRQRIRREDWPRMLGSSMFGVVINQLFFLVGLKYASPIHAALIMTTVPLFVLILSVFLLSYTLKIRSIIGIVISALGTIILITEGGNIAGVDRASLIGDLFILVNAISYSLYLVLVKPLMAKYNPLVVAQHLFVVGLPFLIPIGMYTYHPESWTPMTTDAWLAVVYVLVFVTLFTYGLNLYALKNVRPTTAAIFIYLQPLFATFIAILIGKDHIDSIKIISGILILSGIVLVTSVKQDAAT